MRSPSGPAVEGRRTGLVLAFTASIALAACGPRPERSEGAGEWTLLPEPPARVTEAAQGVWGDSALYVWDPGPRQEHGLIYDPAENRWDLIRRPPSPSADEDDGRSRIGGFGEFALVWTGTELIVWGGTIGWRPYRQSTRGAAYDPTTGRWRVLARSPLLGTGHYAAVWTGTEVIFWGRSELGPGAASAAAAFNPRRNAWRKLPAGPLGPRGGVTAAWTGNEVIIWGGATGGYQQGDEFVEAEPTTGGAAFDPEAGTWRALPAPPLDPRFTPSAVWTGTELIVLGGEANDSLYSDGAAYSPATNGWRRIVPAPFTLRGSPSVWDGREMLVWGGLRAAPPGTDLLEERTREGAAYSPEEDTWRMLPTAPLLPRASPISAWTGDFLVIFGGCCPADHHVFQDGARFSWTA